MFKCFFGTMVFLLVSVSYASGDQLTLESQGCNLSLGDYEVAFPGLEKCLYKDQTILQAKCKSGVLVEITLKARQFFKSPVMFKCKESRCTYDNGEKKYDIFPYADGRYQFEGAVFTWIDPTE